jgi:hypothetical protein
MKLSRPATFVLALSLSLSAAAQWQWIDKTGRKVFSDQPPPADIPDKNILKQPSGKRAMVLAPAAPALAASAPAQPGASAPRLTGKDPQLEAKKKQAEQEEAAKKQAEQEKMNAERAQNCERAKVNISTLQSGRRIAQNNAQGEREFMADDKKEAEIRRNQEIIDRDCGPPKKAV